MAENTPNQTEDDPYDLLSLSFPTEAQTGSDDPYDLEQFGKTKDGFITNLIEGATLRGDRTAQSPFTEYAPEIAGEMLTEATAMRFGIPQLSRRVKTTTEFGNKVMGFVDGITEVIQKGPKKFIAGSTTVGTVGGSSGRAVTTTMYPNSEIAAFLGEFGGSVAADVIPGAAKQGIVSAIDLIPADSAAGKYLIQPLSDANTSIKGFFQRLRSGVDPFNVTPRSRSTFEEAGVTRENVLEGDIARGQTEEVLSGAERFMTPSMRADNFTLMQIEESIIREAKDNALKNETIRNLENINRVVIDGFQFGDAASYSNFMQSRKQYYDDLMAAEMEVAAGEVNSPLQNWSNQVNPDGTVNPARTQQLANELVFKRIDANLDAARKTERAKWDYFTEAAGETRFDTVNFADTYENIHAGADQVARENIPYVEWLEEVVEEGAEESGISALDKDFMIGKTVNAAEVRSMVSQLRSAQRAALTGDNVNYQKAHFAGELAKALNKDLLERIEDVSPLLSDAIVDATDFSTSYNQIFRNDTIQDMYLQNSAGQRRVAPSESLTSAGLFQTEGARESLDNIIRATGVDPSDLSKIEQDPEVISAVEDYLTFRITDDGTFNVEKARDMLVNNELLLDRLPGFQQKLRDVVAANDVSSLRIGELQQSFEPSKTLATTFLNKNVDKVTEDIINSANPTAELAAVMREIAKDKSGAAKMGMKQAFADYIFRQSQSSQRSMTGGPLTRFVSGGKLEDILSNPKIPGLMTMIYSPDELRRWNQIRSTARRVERRQNAPQTLGSVEKNMASKFFSGTAAIAGALFGGEVGSASLGGSFQLANRFARAAEERFRNWINDPTAVFMRDAIFDQDKMNALFADPAGDAGEAAAQTFAAWARSQLTKVGARPYTYNPLIHGINPADEKGENEM